MIIIRRAKQEDRESMWRIHTTAIKEGCKSHYPAHELLAWSGLLKASRYSDAIRKRAVLVALAASTLVGFGQINQASGEIEAVYVNPEYVGRGVGTRILQELEAVVRGSNLQSLHLLSTLNAVPFYKSAGYQAQGHARYLLPTRKVLCLPMKKELSSQFIEEYQKPKVAR